MPIQSSAMPKLAHRFPFQIALGALLLYGVTLSRGVTFNSLTLTAKLAGWDWMPMVSQPVLWLLTLPLRWLPEAWVPAGLKILSALCGAATLGILVRSLELLPWIRPLETLQGWRGKLPLLLAVVACGLEFNFWQDATAATGEMLGLLLLVSVIWCGLEYAAVKKLRWLRGAAFLCGLGVAENWVMQITLPLFLLTLAWLLKKRIVNLKLLLTLAAYGLAGLSVYAVLPVANSFRLDSPWSFTDSWRHSLRESKSTLFGIYSQFWVINRFMAMTAILFFLLPLLAMLLRFKSENTKILSKLNRTILWIFRFVRAGLLLFCLWLAFDPTFGPRQRLAQQASLSLPLLTFDYLNALGIGFLAGNLLLIFLPRDKIRRRRKFREDVVIWLERASLPVLSAVFALGLFGLVIRNLPAVCLANRQPLTQIGDAMLRSLPPGGGIVVSDFPNKLSVLQAALATHPAQSDCVPLDIAMLPMPAYRKHWQRLHADHALAAKPETELGPAEMFSVMDKLSQSNRVFYIHPSFGYFFEVFHQQPVGLVYEMKRLPARSFTPPLLTATMIAQNEKFWDELTPRMELLSRLAEPATSPVEKLAPRCLFLGAVLPGQINLLRQWYSLALDDWGAQLQRNGRLAAAQKRFTQALQLNTNNLAAQLNLLGNANLQAGTPMSLENASRLAEEIGTMSNLKLMLSIWGPMDEPSACYLLGFAYQQAGMPVQAIEQFDRAHALAPDALASEFALAELYARYHLQDRAAATLAHLHEAIKALPDSTNALAQLGLLEARVRSAQTNDAHPDLLSPLAGQKYLPRLNSETNLLK